MWSLSDNDLWEWNKRTKEPFASRTNTLLVGISKLMGDVNVSIAIDNSLPPSPLPQSNSSNGPVQKHVGKSLD